MERKTMNGVLMLTAVALFLCGLVTSAFGDSVGASARAGEGHSSAVATPGQDGHEHDAHAGHGDHAKRENVQLFDVDFTEAFIFRPERGGTATLKYTLREPALVQIRVKDARTRELYLATIVNWELRPPGQHTESWDGRDFEGNLVDMSSASITIVAQRPEHGSGTMPLEGKSVEETVHSEEQHIHGTHHEWAEEVPYLRILEPAAGAVASGSLLIRSAVDADRRGYGNEHGYGLRYYVDGTLAREEYYKPESDGQFAYRLDTTAFEDGEHLLQIGMCDHHQHATSSSVRVVFKNAAD